MQTSSLAVLMDRFPGRTCISLQETAATLGIAYSTITNRISEGTNDIPLRRPPRGGRPLVALAALANYLDGDETTAEKPAPAGRRGRPRLQHQGPPLLSTVDGALTDLEKVLALGGEL